MTPTQDDPSRRPRRRWVSIPEMVGAQLERRWPLWALAAAGFWLAIAGMGDLAPLSLLQLGPTPDDIHAAVAQIGGVGDTQRTLALNIGLLTAWSGTLVGVARRVRRLYYSPVLRNLAFPIAWGAGLAFLFGLARSLLLISLIPDVSQAWVSVISAFGWITWMFIIVAVIYVVPMLVSRWIPKEFRLDPFDPDTIETVIDRQMTYAPQMEVEWQPAPGRTAICISGGGMRSAAFGLGALQATDEAGIYAKARYVSAVSGGSYIASAFAIARRRGNDAPDAWSRGSPEEEYLRRHSTYLAPGILGFFKLLSRLFIGIFVNVLLIGLAVFVAGGVVGWFLSSWLLYPELADSTFSPHTNTWIAVGVLGGAGLAAAVVGSFRRHEYEHERTMWFVIAGFLLFMAIALLILHVVLPWAITGLPDVARRLSTPGGGAGPGLTGFWLFQVFGIGTILAGSLRALLARKRSIFAMLIAGLVVPLLIIAGFLLAMNFAAKTGWPADLTHDADLVWWTAGALLVLIAAIAVSDLTTWSMHQFYKRRLASAFALERTGDKVDAIDYNELPALPDLENQQPELLICAAANVTDVEATPPGSNALTWTFSPNRVGGPQVGWAKVGDYLDVLGSKRHEDLTVPAAVAISGAAISPAMGRQGRGRRSIGALLALANVRLGVWLPNPAWMIARRKDGVRQLTWPPPRATYLAKELFGRYALDDRFLYVTDGGHWENLGLVELLRRGCTDVWCFDAAGDPAGKYNTLGEAIALARAELGVDIEIDPLVMRPPEGSAFASTAHVVGEVSWPGSEVTGRLTYIKTALVEDAPWDVKSFGEKTPDFPYQSTLDQLYEEDQFEAYRALGYHVTLAAIAEQMT